MNSNVFANSGKSNIKISVSAASVYSLCIGKTGAAMLYSVCISGIDTNSVHNIAFSVYGMSKSGFFTEHMRIPAREVFAYEGTEGCCFDFSQFCCRMREEFFRALKSPVTGKLCVEAIIDGVRFLGDAPVTLIPAQVYPHAASPVVFASLLYPYSAETQRLSAAVPEKSLEALYNTLRAERMIYSVRDCDFVTRDIAFEDAEAIFSKRSKMASPLEMALIFCSCALRLGFRPAIAVIKNRKAPRIFCGIMSKDSNFGITTASAAVISDMASKGEVSLFDISCLFTGHNVELADACAAAAGEFSSQDLYFALDICRALRNGVDLCSIDVSEYEQERLFVENLRKINSDTPATLSDYAEQLSDTDGSSLLRFGFGTVPSMPVAFSDFSAIPSLAAGGKQLLIASAADKIDIKKVAPLADGVCSMIVPLEYKRSELTFAERQEIIDAIDYYRSALRDAEAKGAFCSPLRQHELTDMAEYLCDKNHDDSELYLVCGFLRNGENYAPLALYPIKLEVSGGNVFGSFLSPKPYINRLLCEKLKETSYGRKFFGNYGFPGGSLENIVNCFDKFCADANADFEQVKECALAVLPYKNSVLSFSIVDKAEKVITDKLSGAILTGGTVGGSDIVISDQRIADLESSSVGFFDSSVYEICAGAVDGDLIAENVNGKTAGDVAVLLGCENIKYGKNTLICAGSKTTRDDIMRRFDEIGMSDAVLILSDDTDIKESIHQKLVSVSHAELPAVNTDFDEEYRELRRKLDIYNGCKNRRYDFDFSFAEAASAFIMAGEGLSSMQKDELPEPESIFFPDMGKESAAAVFGASLKLCSTRSRLSFDGPYAQHPLYYAKLTSVSDGDINTCSQLAEKCTVELDELIASCTSIAKSAGFDINAVKTLPALHAFLSLLVLISKEYDSGITDKLLLSDIYSVSKRVSEMSALSEKLAETEKELCEFDDGIYTLDPKKLLSEWASPDEMSHSEITKTVNAYRTVSVSGDISKKGIYEVLELLNNHADVYSEFGVCEAEMNELFAGYWNGKNTDWNKITELVNFTKTADVLLKKIHGTDSEARKATAACFPAAAQYCFDNANEVLKAAGVFDRMFSDDGGFVALAELICSDYYNMSFPEGIFSDNGIKQVIVGWHQAAGELSAVAEYNKCCAECEKLGLGCFVHYLANNSFTAETERIFTRSLLQLSLKQMTLYDKEFMSLHNYEETVKRFEELHKNRVAANIRGIKEKHLRACASYINMNSEKAAAFSESLYDNSFSPEEILLRYSDTVKALFPIIIAEPAMAGVLCDFENAVYFETDLVSTATVIPFLHNARHRLMLAMACPKNKKCFANDCRKISVPRVCADKAKRHNGGFAAYVSGGCNVSYLRAPVSSFDKERNTNVLEAQTIGLEILKLLEAKPYAVTDILTFTKAQCSTVRSVLAAVAEKSVAVRTAMDDGRITVDYAGTRRSICCDVLYVSTVYGKDEASAMCLSCGDLDDSAFSVDGIPELAVSALSGSAKSIVVVSSLTGGISPDRTGSYGASSLFAFVEFARCGGMSVCVTDDADTLSPYTTSFGRLASENEIAVSVVHNGNSLVFETDGVKYAAVFENNRARAAFDRECMESFELENRGYKVMRFDGTDITLNPLKILDRIRSIREEM